MADKLVAAGYATDVVEVKYGLTKLTTFAVIVDGKEQSVNPFGHESHSRAQYDVLKETGYLLWIDITAAISHAISCMSLMAAFAILSWSGS